MKERIGATAGRLWEVLGAKGELALSQIAKIIEEKPEIVQAAVGWLAREDKVEFIVRPQKNKREAVFVTLSSREREVYKQVNGRPEPAAQR